MYIAKLKASIFLSILCVYIYVYVRACMCMDVHASSVYTSIQVGAAISMTYITGQPIVFVGTGQTYSDLKNLNVQSVVQALLS